MLSQPVVRRLVLARYLFELALQNVRSQQETGDAACVSLLQDATEIFFVAALDRLNVQQSKPKTEFLQQLDKLSEAINSDLPYRRRLLEVNRVRVSAKHDGILPNRKEIDGYVTDTRKFLEEVCQKALGVDFWTVSLIDLIEDGEAKEFLLAAENAHRDAQYAQCLTDCRKAFFATFETFYDTQMDLNNSFAIFGSRAPYYARDKEYIKKNVRDHFSYVVLFKERSAFVLASMTSILLARQNTKRAARYIEASNFSDVKVKAGAKFYEKADKSGPVAGVLPEGKDQASISYATQGLSDEDWYWRAMYENGGGAPAVVVGYVLEADLIDE